MRTITRIAVAICAVAAFPLAITGGCGTDTTGSGKTSSSSSSSGAAGSENTGGAGGKGGSSATGGKGGASTGGAAGSAGAGNGGMAGAAGAGTGGANVGGAGGGSSSSSSSSSSNSSSSSSSGMIDDAGSDAAPVIIMPVKCLNQTYQCGDAIDNDMDGLTDWQDPDCLGPCDNTENSYYGGIPGQSGPNCDVDCYWDSNSGSGDDHCYWNHKCDILESTMPGSPEPYAKCAYNPNTNIGGTAATCMQLQQMQEQGCYDFCLNITPNGCDCFGCCELPSGSGKYVWLGSEVGGAGSCTADVINDVTKCKPCTPVPSCMNACAECEICIGKPDLPPQCTLMDGGGSSQCPPNVQPCGEIGQAACPAGYYCVTGCCKSLTGP